VREHIISLLLNNTDSFTKTHFLYLHRDKYAAPNSTHKTRENPCLIHLSKIHFLFFVPPQKSYYHFSLSCHPLSSSLMRKTTHLGSNWKTKLIKSATTTTTTKVAVLVVAPHSSSSSILHHHHHHLFFDLKLLSSPSPSPLGSTTCLKNFTPFIISSRKFVFLKLS
jgi:hypothetical protein